MSRLMVICGASAFLLFVVNDTILDTLICDFGGFVQFFSRFVVVLPLCMIEIQELKVDTLLKYCSSYKDGNGVWFNTMLGNKEK